MNNVEGNSIVPLVSVCIQTYQHGQFIREALEGVLSQETSFPYEILLGEDGSTDGTREICIEYAKKYPEIIRLFLRDRKDVIYINGLATGRANFINNITCAKGKYIALLPGDDYWVDNYKLQKQVDCLESNRDYSICFHSARVYDEASKTFIKDVSKQKNTGVVDIKELIDGNLIPSASVVYRNNYLDNFPAWFYTFPVGDWPLHLFHALRGKIYYLSDSMSVFRQNEKSYWAKSRENRKIILQTKVLFYENIEFYFKKEIYKYIHVKRCECCEELFVMTKGIADLRVIHVYLIKYYQSKNNLVLNPLTEVIGLILRHKYPRVYFYLKNMHLKNSNNQ